MGILKIVWYPDPVLKTECPEISCEAIAAGSVDGVDLRQLAADMLETMYDAPGVGLAAPQVGKCIRMFVLDVSPEHDAPRVVLNPRIVAKKGRVVKEEGCLSFPKIYGNVRRAETITAEYVDLEGDKQTVNAEGLLSRAFQHELDHLDGVLYIDKMTQASKLTIHKELAELRKKYKS